MVKALRGFPLGLEISVVLHVVVVAIIYAILHFHPNAVALPPVNDPFEHAIAVSIEHPPKPQPKPKVTPPETPKPKPLQPAIATEATQQLQQTSPPLQNPPPPTMPQQEQTQEQVNPDYEQIAMAILERNKRYPRQALLSGTEGTVEITFVLNSQGTVLSYTIEKPSGHDELDAEVRRLIHAVRFPPFPTNYTQPRMTLNVTIQFTLKGNVGP